MKNDDIIGDVTAGFLIGILSIAVFVFIFNLITPTKRQAYKVYKENNLTIVEEAEE